MAIKSHHVVPKNGDWAVRPSQSDRVSRIFDTKREAVDWGRDISRRQNTELIIHDKTGQFQQRDSHGNDPVKSKG
jgi:hypothetical protein